MFGYISVAIVKNVGIVDCDIKGRYNVGGVVGYIYSGTVQNCYATGNVSGTGISSQQIGGVVGLNDSGGTVENCVALNPNISGSAGKIGRVVGLNSGTIANNYGRINVSPGGWPDTGADDKDGEGITDSTTDGWNSGNTFWKDKAQFTNVWNIVNGSLPTLMNMPGRTQNPVLQ